MTRKAFIGIAGGGLALAFGITACLGGGSDPATVDVVVPREVTVEVTRVVSTTITEDIYVEVPVTRELEVTRELQVPVTREKEIPVTYEVYITQEVPVEVEVEVTREVTVAGGEVIREVTVEAIREVTVSEVVEVTREVPVSEVVEVTREVTREVPVTPIPSPSPIPKPRCEHGDNVVKYRQLKQVEYEKVRAATDGAVYPYDIGKVLKGYKDWADWVYCERWYANESDTWIDQVCPSFAAHVMMQIYDPYEKVLEAEEKHTKDDVARVIRESMRDHLRDLEGWCRNLPPLLEEPQ